MKQTKPVCLHFHIFKNAGTTIEWTLQKNFSKNFISIDTDNPQGIINIEKILDILRKNPRLKAISSHQIRFPIHNNEFEFIPILMIRHPIDRAISIYQFQRKRTDANRPGIVKAKELDLNGYIKWNLGVKNHMAMKNFQVLFLSDKPASSTADIQDYQIALQRLKECKIIGVVDRFDESLVVAEETLRDHFPKIDLSYVKQNVSKRNESLEQSLKEGEKQIDKSILEKLLESNMFDLKIYLEANHELDKRIKNTENFELKLTEFKERCKVLN